MAELTNHETHAPAEMDYPEHDRTYGRFLAATKWGTIIVVALLLGMMVGLMLNGGFTGGIGVFLLVMVVAWFVAR